MKRLARSMFGLMVFALFAGGLPSANAAGQDSAYKSVMAHNSFDLKPASAVTARNGQSPPAIVLNGLTTIFGDRRALFKVMGGLPPRQDRSYFLSEGQRDGDVELLGVDVKRGIIRVDIQGTIEVVTICQAPAILTLPDTTADGKTLTAPFGDNGNPASAIAAGHATPGDKTSAEMQPAAAGPPAFAGGAVKSPNASTDNSLGNPGSSVNDSIGDSVGGNSGNPAKADPWWMKEAKKIEQARQATAQKVTDGQWQPYPLTPLTPPGTPSQLIGSGSAFFYYNPVASTE